MISTTGRLTVTVGAPGERVARGGVIESIQINRTARCAPEGLLAFEGITAR
jgi:hypothetical protein